MCPDSMASICLASVARTAAVLLRMLSTADSQKLSVRARAFLHFFSIPTSVPARTRAFTCAALLHSCIPLDLKSSHAPALSLCLCLCLTWDVYIISSFAVQKVHAI